MVDPFTAVVVSGAAVGGGWFASRAWRSLQADRTLVATMYVGLVLVCAAALPATPQVSFMFMVGGMLALLTALGGALVSHLGPEARP